jgi:minor extracellular serine protease Vpr
MNGLRRRRGRRSRLAVFLVLGLVVGLLAAVTPVAGGAVSDSPTVASGDTGYVEVTLKAPAAVYYSGGIKQLKATAPTGGGRFNADSRAFRQYKSHLEAQHARFAARLAAVAPDAKVVGEFFITANAVIVELNGTAKATVLGIRGVKKVRTSGLVRLDLNESAGLIGAPAMWALDTRADAGDGVKVGIIDGGIDPTHEFFSCKTIHFGGVYFSGQGIYPQIPSTGAIFGPNYSPTPGDPLYFSTAHGTHVAGEIGGCVTTIDAPGTAFDGLTVSGIAPGAELWDYNVFPNMGAGMVAFDGSALNHDIGLAIEDAVADGMDVINLSLGGGIQGKHDFLAEVADAAVAADVVVVASAGNDGPDSWTVGSPASAANVIAAGASTNSHYLSVKITTDAPDATVYDAIPGEFRTDFDHSANYWTLQDWGGGVDGGDGCTLGTESFAATDVVLIKRGTCSFSQKVANAKAAGAGGVIVYNDGTAADREDPIPMATSPDFDDDIPAVMVSHTDGIHLESIALTKATIAAPALYPTTPNELADFSSQGPTAFTYAVKPDVLAPGTNILSSVITYDLLGVTGHGWELYDGTSMAAPHTSGSAALLLWQHPGWTPQQVKSALMTTATDAGYSVWEQGAGIVDIPSANAASVFFSPSSASFGFFNGSTPAVGSIDIAIDGSCSAASASGSAYASASVSGSTLTVAFDAGRGAPADFYGGTVSVTCGSDTYTLPWGAVIKLKPDLSATPMG